MPKMMPLFLYLIALGASPMQAKQFIEADFPNPYYTAPLIAQESSFDFNTVHTNNNGTQDVGPCQINDIHGYTLEERQGLAGLHLCAKMLRKGQWFHSNNSIFRLKYNKLIALRIVKAAYSSNYSYTRIYSSVGNVVRIITVSSTSKQKLHTLESLELQTSLTRQGAWHATCIK